MSEENKSPEREAAEVEKLRLESERLRIEIEQERVQLESDNHYLSQRRKVARDDEASDDENFVYYFNTGVTGSSVTALRQTLSRWGRYAPSGREFTIVINSGGGSVFDGLDAGDCIEQTISAGHPVQIVVAGMAASMAGVILQFGSHRVCGRNSYIHLHEVSTGALGKASDLRDTADLAEALTRRACDIYARRSNLTSDEIYELMNRHEVWLTAEEALEHGFIDEIR